MQAGGQEFEPPQLHHHFRDGALYPSDFPQDFVFKVLVPLLKSCPLPINPTDPVLSVYREIEGVAEKNGVVLLSFSMEFSP